MRVFKLLKKVHIALILFLLSTIAVIHIAQAVTAEPGTNEDPIVSQSYVDAKIGELNATINSLKQQLQNTQYPKFEVIEVEAGKQLVAGASTELILRGGEATAVASNEGGISNLISGKDLKTGEQVPLDQLLLIPRDDGRGLKIVKKSWILIKGQYTIK